MFIQLKETRVPVESWLLRPRRYRLLLKNEATKSMADQPMTPQKRSKHSTGVSVRGATGIHLSKDQKTIIRPAVVDNDILTGIGLGENQNLNIVDGITGQLEYSIKCIDQYPKRSDYSDVFKGIWTHGSSRSLN